MATLYEVDQRMNTQALEYFVELATVQGVITNTIIGTLTTAAGLAGIDTTGAANVPIGPIRGVNGTAYAGYEVDRRFAQQYSNAIQRAIAIGVITNANVAAAGNIAGIISLFTAVSTDPTVTALSATNAANFMHTTVA